MAYGHQRRGASPTPDQEGINSNTLLDHPAAPDPTKASVASMPSSRPFLDDLNSKRTSQLSYRIVTNEVKSKM
jgi:hypothetical protein